MCVRIDWWELDAVDGQPAPIRRNRKQFLTGWCSVRYRSAAVFSSTNLHTVVSIAVLQRVGLRQSPLFHFIHPSGAYTRLVPQTCTQHVICMYQQRSAGGAYVGFEDL